MTTHQRSRRGRRAVARLCRSALVAVIVGLAVLCGTGVADAEPGSGGSSSSHSASRSGQVTPTLDCIVRNGRADYTAVLGYTSTHRSTVTIPVGTDNKLSASPDGSQPTSFPDGSQPTSFQPGTHHGVFSVRVTTPVAFWTLDGNRLVMTSGAADTCSAGVVMPATGNGTGPAIGLAVAGLVGAFALRRWRRRALPSSRPGPPVPSTAPSGS